MPRRKCSKTFVWRSGKKQGQCRLAKKRCVAKTRAGNARCKNHVCIGIGRKNTLCWLHLMRKKHLRIKQSNIASAGNGLFAVDRTKKPNAIIFRKGSLIVEYYGRIVNTNTLNKNYPGNFDAPYTICDDVAGCVDAGCARGVAAMANHSKKQYNAKVIAHGTLLYLKAAKNIRNGEEIMFNYQDQYWDGPATQHYTR